MTKRPAGRAAAGHRDPARRAQGANVTEGIVAAIRRHSDAPLKILVNTHVHADHMGGTENFGKMGMTIMARPNLRKPLLQPAPAANGQTPAPSAASPPCVFVHRDAVAGFARWTRSIA